MGILQRDQGSLAGVTSAGPWGGISGNAFTTSALNSAAPHAGCEHSRRRRTQERELWNGAQLCPRSKSFTCCLRAGPCGFHSEPGRGWGGWGGVLGTQVPGGREGCRLVGRTQKRAAMSGGVAASQDWPAVGRGQCR